MTYAHTSDGSTVDQHRLPQSLTLTDGRSVSNPAALDPATLAAEGWLPLVDADDPTPGAGEQLGGWTYIVHADRIERARQVVAVPEVSPQDEIAARFGPRARVLYVTGTESFIVMRIGGDPSPRRLWITLPGVDGPVVCDCVMVPTDVPLLDVHAVAAAGVDHIEATTRPALQTGTLEWEPLPDEVLADVVAELVDPAAVAAAVTAAANADPAA